MSKVTSFKADAKMIIRDPILILFFILPIFIPLVFKVGLPYATQFTYNYLGINLINYYGYVLSLTIFITPLMLGTVSAFLLIDERDSKIQELIKITPVGYRGYLANRLMLPLVGSMIYTIVNYFVLNIYYIDTMVLLIISILSGIEGIMIGYLLYELAADKVQGLTYSKGFGVFSMLALADLFHIKWFSIIAGFTPFYWITRLVINFDSSTAIIGVLIHMIYLFILFGIDKRWNSIIFK